MRTHWQVIVFQAIFLDVAQSSSQVDSQETFFRRLPAIKALLNRIDFVGCLEDLDAYIPRLATTYGWPPPPPAPRLNTVQEAGADGAQVSELRTA